MDFKLEETELYKLSSSEARLVLENFLGVERSALAELQHLPVSLDYSRESVIGFFRFGILERVGSDRNVDIYSVGFEEDEARVVWVGRMAYYLGESLVRSSNRLRWDIGGQESAFANHPVIAGFENGVEAPVFTISRVSAARVLMDKAPFDVVVDAIDHWFMSALN